MVDDDDNDDEGDDDDNRGRGRARWVPERWLRPLSLMTLFQCRPCDWAKQCFSLFSLAFLFVNHTVCMLRSFILFPIFSLVLFQHYGMSIKTA